MFKILLLALGGFSYGLLAAAGVFTVLAAVGLVPRFAGRTHTARFIFLYEEMVVAGTVAGGVFSLFADEWQAGAYLAAMPFVRPVLCRWIGTAALAVFGLFCGMFVGCLALAIAEMLDSIPIFARRISFRHGIGLAVLSMAAGKVAGSLFYFLEKLYHTVE